MRHVIKQNTYNIPRFFHKLFFVLIIIMCIGAKESLCAENDTTEIVTKKKSYILAGAGALVCPALGHSYIGGDNVRRGLLYTANEIVVGYNIFQTVAAAFGQGDGPENPNYYPIMFVATHVTNVIDALISVHNKNSHATKKSYFIATAGSALFPINAIGHGYIGDENYMRGWYYSFASVILSVKYSENTEIRKMVGLISMADALARTYKYNQSITNVSIVPGKSSVKLMITKTF
ncbi:hypothetical protein ACFL6K_06525 [Candidatus Latescibacterota bacterium]